MAPAELEALPATAGWAELAVGRVTVGELAAEVSARIWKHRGSCVGPITLDLVHFERAAAA